MTEPSGKRCRSDGDRSTRLSLAASDIITIVCPVDEAALAKGDEGATGELAAYRCVLERSPVWSIALHSDWQEARRRRIYIKDYTIETVETMLNALTHQAFGCDDTHISASIPLDQAQAVLVCAGQYQLKEVKRLAEKRLCDEVDAASTQWSDDRPELKVTHSGRKFHLPPIRPVSLTETANLGPLWRFARDYDAPLLADKCIERLNFLLDLAIPQRYALQCHGYKVATWSTGYGTGHYLEFSAKLPILSATSDSATFFAFIRQLRDAGVDEVLQRVPATIARLAESLQNLLYCLLSETEEKPERESAEDCYKRRVLPIIDGFGKATVDEMPAARLAMRAILRSIFRCAVRSRRSVFLDLLMSRSPPQWMIDEKTLQEKIFTAKVQLQVEYRDVVDASGATVVGIDNHATIGRYKAGYKWKCLQKCDAFSEAWREKWRGVPVPLDTTSDVVNHDGAAAVMNFLKATGFVGQNFEFESINHSPKIRGLAIGVECKTEVGGREPSHPADVRLLLTLDGEPDRYNPHHNYFFSQVDIVHLLELAGHDLEDMLAFPKSLKLVVMDFRAIEQLVKERRDMPWLLGAFGLVRGALPGECFKREFSVEDFVDQVNYFQ